MAKGTLFGVGVGPGDPKLMTIRAGELVRDADVLAFPVNQAGDSRARTIAAPVISAHAEELPVHIPMQTDPEPAQAAYDEAAAKIAQHLDAGKNVAWLCVGDPMFYGTFMYLAARLGDAYPLEIIPGVTSLTACAARSNNALARRNDILSVIPATLGEDDLSGAIQRADSAIIIKVGRHYAKVRRVLDGLGLSAQAIILEGATGADESISSLADISADDQSYFSTILVRQGAVA